MRALATSPEDLPRSSARRQPIPSPPNGPASHGALSLNTRKSGCPAPAAARPPSRRCHLQTRVAGRSCPSSRRLQTLELESGTDSLAELGRARLQAAACAASARGCGRRPCSQPAARCSSLHPTCSAPCVCVAHRGSQREQECRAHGHVAKGLQRRSRMSWTRRGAGPTVHAPPLSARRHLKCVAAQGFSSSPASLTDCVNSCAVRPETCSI